MNTICLCMIVKDETGVIERCLNSVKDLISYWVICDTGSTDGTQEKIRDVLAEVPGELHERPWVDFGHNRTEALKLARGKADYLLLLDADWTFSAQPGALSRLNADAYLVRQVLPQGHGLELNNRNLVRGDREWWYVGATHEYIETKGKISQRALKGAFIKNCGDGGVGRERRWRQDAELLERAVEQDLDNTRNVFYLAQTYRDLGELQRSIDLYERRAAMGGWDEEVFYSLYQVGVMLDKLGDWEAAEPALVKAWKYRPTRIEPLHRLAVGFRLRAQHEQAHQYTVLGLNRPLPRDDLYVEPWIYRWGMLFEYSVSSYWAGDMNEALKACELLLKRDDIPAEYWAHVQENRELSVRALRNPRSSDAPRFAVRGGQVVVNLPKRTS